MLISACMLNRSNTVIQSFMQGERCPRLNDIDFVYVS